MLLLALSVDDDGVSIGEEELVAFAVDLYVFGAAGMMGVIVSRGGEYVHAVLEPLQDFVSACHSTQRKETIRTTHSAAQGRFLNSPAAW